MHRFIGAVFAAFVWSLPLPAFAAGFLQTLGIDYVWNMAETKAAFAKAHIPEKDFGNDRLLESAVSMIMTGALIELRKDLAADSVMFSTMNVAELAPPKCLYYENGIEPRDDIALVAVCFYGKDRQVIVAPFFSEGKIDGATLRKYMDEEYGTGKVAQTGTGKDWVSVWLWFERPWIHAGMLTKIHLPV